MLGHMQEQRPNIILITTDQQRGDCLGSNGNQILQTPNLDALASKGVNFTRSYVTCPVCIPARRTLISGMSPDSHKLRGYRDGLPFDPPATLPGCLGSAGYQTQLIGKLHLHPQGKRYGFDNIILSETSHYRPRGSFQKRNDYVQWLRSQGNTEHPHSHGISSNGRYHSIWGMEERFHQNNWLTEEAGRFLTQTRDPSCPFFLHLSFFHPHPPLVPLQKYFSRYASRDLPPAALGDWSPPYNGELRAPDSPTGPFAPEVIQEAKAAYYALINHIDDCVARIIDQYREYGSGDSDAPLYILFSSDHGEMLGDHQLFRKSLGYEASARVPFFISGYNVPLHAAGSDALVCWEDIAPTLLDLAGVPVPDSMDGHSLKPLLTGKPLPAERPYIFGQCEGNYHNLWITTERWKYIWYLPTNEEQLFDLRNDPNECHDLSASTEQIEPLRDMMKEAVRNRDDIRYNTADLVPCANRPPKVFWQ